MMSSSLVQFLLALSAAAVLVSGQQQREPGGRVQLSQSGLNYAAQTAVDVLSRTIRGRTIPNQSGSNRVDPVGNVKWEVNNGQVTDFTKPSTSVGVSPAWMTWSMHNAGIKVKGDWKYEYKVWRIKFRDSGTFELTVSGATASVKVRMTRSPEGRPQVSVDGCSCSISGVDVRFRGGQSWLYNLFSGVIERPIKSELERILCEEATKAINLSGNQELGSIMLEVPLRNGPIMIDCKLLSDPLLADGYIETSHRAEAYLPGDTNTLPFSAQPMPFISTPRMVSVSLSEHIGNSIGQVIYNRGVLTHRMTRDDIRSDILKDFLSTTCTTGICFGSLFPAAGLRYPNAVAELHMSATEPPSLSIVPTAATGRFKGDIDVVLRLSDNTTLTVLTLDVSANLSISIQLEDMKFTTTVVDFSPYIIVRSSQLGGNHPEAELNALLAYASDNFIVPELNEIGLEGFRLPNMDGVSFVNAELITIDKAVVLTTDVQYTAP